MRTLRLARVAADAEILRLRMQAKRLIRRVVYGVIALIFALGLIAWAHFVGFIALEKAFTPLISALIVLGVDVVIAIIFGLLAASGSPTQAEHEAMQIRKQAVVQLAGTMATVAALRPAARLFSSRPLYAIVLGAFASRFLRKSAKDAPR